jgi:hypothetical protein
VARHVRVPSSRWRAARAGALTVIWLAGLASGFFAILAAASRFSCSPSAHGLACRPAGTAVSTVLVLGVIATVTSVTVATHDSGRRRLVGWTVGGAIMLALCFLLARAVIATA